jgi:serine/threonine protein phosphatase PrpC
LPISREAARRLVDLANEAGGRDNTSVVLVQVNAAGVAQAPNGGADPLPDSHNEPD